MASSSNQNLGGQHLSLPNFDGERYDFWSVKMKTIFLSQGLWDYVEEGYDEADDAMVLTIAQMQQLKEHRKKDAKALALIQQGVVDTIFPRIINATRAKEAWEILQKEYRGTAKVRNIKIQSLRRDFENLKMKEVELLQDYFSRLTEIVNQMETYGEKVSDQRIVQKILISLPEKYDPIVAIIEETKEISDLGVEELMGSIKAFEQRLSR